MLALVLVVALPLALPAFPQEAEAPVLRPGEVIEGVVEDDDEIVETETLRAGGYTREHAVRGQRFLVRVDEPGTYRVELRSDLFDAYLVLRSASGEVLAEDDDGLIGTHARVVTGLDPTKTLRVEACALHGGRGSFELRLERGQPPTLSPRERAQAEIGEARRRVEVLEAEWGSEHPDLARSLDLLANLLYRQGANAQARPLLARSLTIREKLLGAEHPALVESLNVLALVHWAEGDAAEARRLWDRALGIVEGLGGGESPSAAAIRINLAGMLHRQGDYAAARQLYERALPIMEEAFGEAHPQLATTLNNFSLLLRDQGDHVRAERLQRRALAIREARFGREHVETATSLHNLGLILQDRGDFAAAGPLFEQALEVWERLRGEENPDLATCLDALGGLRLGEGNAREAKDLYERALGIRTTVLGPTHPDVANSYSNLAGVFQHEGDYAAARAHFERALAIRQEVLSGDHPDLATSWNNLALLLFDQGDYARARPLQERALEIQQRVLGDGHPEVAISLNNLAALRKAQGDLVGARVLYERAMAIRERSFGELHPSVAEAANNLAVILQAQGDFSGARSFLERALSIRERTVAPDHPDLARTLQNLAALHWAQGDCASAEPLMRRALDMRERAYGALHPDVGDSLNNLAGILACQGDYEAARALYERGLVVYQQVFGEEHPWVGSSLGNLALTLANLGAWSEAAAQLERLERIRASAAWRTLWGLSESERHLYLAQLRWQEEIHLSAATWGAIPARVYDSLLAWKAQVFRLSRIGRARLTATMTAQDVDKLTRLRDVQARLSRAGARSRASGAFASPANLDALIAERGRLERELQRTSDPLRVDPPTWDSLRAALPERSALVDLFVQRVYAPAEWQEGQLVRRGDWSEARVVAWVTRAEWHEPVRCDLGPASTLEEIVRGSLVRSIVGARGGSLGPELHSNDELSERIWDPLREHLAQADLVFVSPDGVLATLPFEVLRDGDGRYLVEDRSFVYLTDPELLVSLARRPQREVSSLLTVGGVDYDRAEDVPEPRAGERRPGASVPSEEDDPADGGGAGQFPAGTIAAADLGAFPPRDALRGERGDTWPALDATHSEAEQVHARHELAVPGGTCLLLQGPAATEERLKAELPRHEILHLATHGYFQPEGFASLEDAAEAEVTAVLEERRPLGQESFSDVAQRLEGYHPGLLSGLVCAGVNRGLPEGRDDGYLTAEEVSWLDLSGVDLAVLSACDTGLGRPQSGEGLLGLRRAFLMSGAQTVVSSLWSVPDQATAAFMDLFYRNLWQRGMGKQQALRAAQLETIEKNRAEHGHARPATWGAFVLDGDWR